MYLGINDLETTGSIVIAKRACRASVGVGALINLSIFEHLM
jgi:hypothetical protein